jgi:hypothetical protein
VDPSRRLHLTPSMSESGPIFGTSTRSTLECAGRDGARDHPSPWVVVALRILWYSRHPTPFLSLLPRLSAGTVSAGHASESSVRVTQSAHRNVTPTDDALQKRVSLPPKTMGLRGHAFWPHSGHPTCGLCVNPFRACRALAGRCF